MSRRALLALLALAAFLVAAIPAVAKTKAKTSSVPVVKKVRPLKLKLGERLSIYGSGFKPGRGKDTVVFMGPGKRVVWVKASKAGRKKISVVLPSRLSVLLADKTGKLQPTRLLIRVIAKKSGKRFTKRRISPIVLPNASIQTAPPTAEACPGVSLANGDSDGDWLPNGLEFSLGTNPCKADSDGDGVPDGYEYQAALDFNRTAGTRAIPYPFPGKRPYPNPLDGSDAKQDFDGDSLTLLEEYEASFPEKIPGLVPAELNYHPAVQLNPYDSADNYNVMAVAYSDGDQTTNWTPIGDAQGIPTGPSAPCTPLQNTSSYSGFDVNGNGVVGSSATPDPGDVLSYQGDSGFVSSALTPLGWMNEPERTGANCYLSDDEKDVDGDGLSNYTETHGPLMGQSWWNTFVPKAGTYPIDFDGTNWLVRDTDGDGVPDGADDQDHDGYSNIEESLPVGKPAAANQAESVWHYPVEDVNPNIDAFDPCLPNDMSPACPRHPVSGQDGYAPYAPDSPAATFHDPNARIP